MTRFSFARETLIYRKCNRSDDIYFKQLKMNENSQHSLLMRQFLQKGDS